MARFIIHWSEWDDVDNAGENNWEMIEAEGSRQAVQEFCDRHACKRGSVRVLLVPDGEGLTYQFTRREYTDITP
jgi:hypothetical protein